MRRLLLNESVRFISKVEKLEILEAIQAAEDQLEQGLGIEHSEAKAGVLEDLEK